LSLFPQGINLTAADTCIIYDSDWNPQQDLQVGGITKGLFSFLGSILQNYFGRKLMGYIFVLKLWTSFHQNNMVLFYFSHQSSALWKCTRYCFRVSWLKTKKAYFYKAEFFVCIDLIGCEASP
jgi:hypothetical protein